MVGAERRDGGGSAVAGETTRIFIGGLGETVTEDDLRKTFSPLGEVIAADIVRTKGRSLAYLDFLPSSDKSLAKLFSTYNGCMWKGGRLRLEKAKEHYLLRLRREWLEDTEHASDASMYDADASDRGSPEKPKKLPSSDKMQLRMFFPKLKKVKSLSFGGTGKHKYSFQRVNVPSMPIHFCDCEEHSGPSLITKKVVPSEPEAASVGINEEELNIMNSVMNKLFEREHCSKAACGGTESANEGNSPVNSNDDLLAGENEPDLMTDEEDNLIINIVGGEKNKTAFSRSRGKEAVIRNQGPIVRDRLAQNMRDSQNKKNLPHSKKRKSPYLEESNGNEIVSSITEKTSSSQVHLNIQEDRTADQELASRQSKRNSLWSQKSAWRDLIGQNANSPFSISDIVPSIPDKKEAKPITDDIDAPFNTDQSLEKHGNAKSQLSHSKDLDKLAEVQPTRQNEAPNGYARTNTQFSISDIIPDVPGQKEEEPITDDVSTSFKTDVENQRLGKHGNAESQSGQSKDLDELAEALPSKQNEASNGYARGTSWLHKSSWTQLVASTSNSPFSISQVLPCLPSDKQEVQLDSTHAVHSAERSETTGVPFDASPLAKKDAVSAPQISNVIALAKNDHCPTGLGIEQISSEKELQTAGKKNEVSALSTVAKQQSSERKQPSLGNFDFEETCPFMRTDASMKEWKKVKTALSGSLKKKEKGKLK